MRIERNKDELRLINIERNYLKHPTSSVLMEIGETKIIITATIEERVPKWRHRTGKGWLTAEYNMLPGSTQNRKQRPQSSNMQDGRSVEISRLIGRSLRTCIDLDKIGERTIWIDCDVIQADGGTRCASITGGFVVLFEAAYKLYKEKVIKEFPIKHYLAAVSVGKLNDQILLDLDYEEDSVAQVDANVIMTGDGEFVEIQASGEEGTFTEEEFMQMLEYSKLGIKNLIYDQKYALADILGELENEKNTTSN